MVVDGDITLVMSLEKCVIVLEIIEMALGRSYMISLLNNSSYALYTLCNFI